MVRLEIQHFTKYTYSEPVSLGPQNLFLIPQQRSYFNIERSRLLINPQFEGLNERLDLEGNSYYQTWFIRHTEFLEIETDFIIQSEKYNPYGFILSEGNSFPFRFYEYSEDQKLYLRPFLKTEDYPELKEFAFSVLFQSKDLIGFLVRLISQIHSEWRHTIREDHGIWPSSQTFVSKQGSCRDLSWMLMEILRSIGLATRFVSGYAFNPELEEGHELHAWVEIYLPGGGWIGVDPSLGLFTDHHYIPLASSFDPKNTFPVQGTYGGAGNSTLHAEVWIKEI
ncbi:transglutaminase family protein [Shivajiella indica]|uniref:Transglutaminase domain-containing protein n=1 Tax=Shivajiella indica TaxID=872115 RepID=A0ABW5BBW7_9BACT